MHVRTFRWMIAVAVALPLSSAIAGDLTPPAGPVGPTMKPLSQIEPRIAVSAANTPGDNSSPASVYKITQPGSYYLTGSFQAPADRVGILITCNDVSLDLGGFTITSGLAGVFATSAGGPGIPTSNLSISNGSVRGATAIGIGALEVTASRFSNLIVIDCESSFYLGDRCIVEDCIAADCDEGFQVGQASVLRNCSATGNDNAGIYVSDGSTVSNCVAANNGSYGYILGNGSTITASVARDNGSVGIGALQECIIVDCAAQENGTDGVTTGQGCVIRNTASGNSGRHGFAIIAGTSIEDCTARGNGEDGINATWQCSIVGNTCMSNGATAATGAGIRVTSWGSRIENNTVFMNDRGLIVSSTDNMIMRNIAKNSTGNYDVVAGNEFAPVITNPGTTFTNATPWSNFAY